MRRSGSGLLAFAIVATRAGSGAAVADTLVVQGSTTFAMTLVQPHRAEVEAATGHRLEVHPNKSSLGLLALFERNADLAMISSSLEIEVDLLRKSAADLPYDRLHAFPIGRTWAAFVVNPTNPVRRASLQQIRDILVGGIDNWKELGGPDLPIRIVAIRTGGGVLASVEARLLGGGQIKDDSIRVQMGTQVTRVVAQEPGALGITHLTNLRRSGLPELVTESRLEQILSFVSLDQPSPQALSVIESFRRLAESPE